MSRKHSTLLKEEVDDEENGSGTDGVGKKREKDKDGEYKKKKAYKKGDKNEGYFNDSMTKTARAIGGAAVNPSAETVTSPVHTQQPGAIPAPLQPPPSGRHQNQQSYASSPNMQSYGSAAQGQSAIQVSVHSANAATSNWQPPPQHHQQQAMVQRLPPPPGTQHVQMAQQYQVQAPGPLPQTQYAPQNVSPSQRQVYQGQPPPSQGQVYQPGPSQQQGQNYQNPLSQQQGQVYQPPSPQQAQNYQAQPQQQGQNYQTPSSQQQGQVYKHPPPQHQGQNYQAPPPQQGFYAVGIVGYPGGAMVHPNITHGHVAHSQGPQSPTGQGQAHDPNWQQYTDGNWSGHPNDSSWTGQPVPADQQRDGNWAAFDGSHSQKIPQEPKRKEITWRESPDNSSSGEEIESNDDDDDEEQQELIRPPSPSKSSSSIEEEHETSPWQIQPEQYEYYTNQFKRLQPGNGVVKGPKARDFFLKSNLSTEILSKVWHLSDINQDNALDLDEFCIAMHLVVAIRHGLDLPFVLPNELLHHRQLANELQEGQASEDSIETIEEDSKHLNTVQRNRSLSDTSLNEDHHPEVVSRKTSMPATTKIEDDGRTLSPDPNVKIPRPKATNISLIDSRPGQLLPPPQPGKYPTWTPTKADQDSDSAESDDDDSERSSSDDDDEPRPLSPGPTAAPIPMPALNDSETKDEEEEQVENEEGIPTPPSTPKGQIPQPVLPDVAQVTRRLSKKSIERPRSAGDVNDMLSNSDGSSGSTPTNSSIGSDGRKEPPPPPPRRKEKGHSRSSSLDLNKLFGPKSKEDRANTFGSPTSSQSSHTSQSEEVSLPLKSEPKQENEDSDVQTADDSQENSEKPAKEENFADFSNFETLVKAQGTSSDSHMSVTSQGRTHRRSLSLDHAQDYWPKTSQTNNFDSAIDGHTKNQEALPRPVPKLKHPVSPPVKLLTLNKQTPRKDGNEERKLKTEPPKVVVKPLTKESKLQNSIRELKETNLLLSRLNSELQQENKEMMEQRISLELKLEQLQQDKSK